MSKKLILLLATCLLVTSCLFGCGDDTKPSDDNPTTTASEVESTTKEDVATTEPTTEEPTPEETTTKYVYKGMEFAIESVNKDLFIDLVVEKGYKFKVNDFVDKNASDVVRGLRTLDLFKALFSEDINKIIEFENKYFEPGATVIEIACSENVVIEYDGEKKLCFYLVEDNGEYAYFDVYNIN